MRPEWVPGECALKSIKMDIWASVCPLGVPLDPRITKMVSQVPKKEPQGLQNDSFKSKSYPFQQVPGTRYQVPGTWYLVAGTGRDNKLRIHKRVVCRTNNSACGRTARRQRLIIFKTSFSCGGDACGRIPGH